EVAINSLGLRQILEPRLTQAECPIQKAARSSGIENASDSKRERVAAVLPRKPHTAIFKNRRIQGDTFAILDTSSRSFADEKMINLRAIPVRIGDRVVWTCGDEKLIVSIGSE